MHKDLEPKPLAGLLVDVLVGTHGRDALSVIPESTKHLIVVDPRVGGPFPITEERQALRLVTREICGKPYVHAEPVGHEEKWLMFGGRYITGDSRLREINPYPIPLHDRYEKS